MRAEPVATEEGQSQENFLNEIYEDDMAAENAILDMIDRTEPPGIPPDIAPTRPGGRPAKVNPIKLVAWRQAHKASIRETAMQWKVSEATVKRLSRDYGPAAALERERWQRERLDEELRQHEYEYGMMFLRLRNQRLRWVEFEWFGRCQRAKGTPQEDATEAARAAALDEADRQFREEWLRTIGPIPSGRGGSEQVEKG